MLRSLIALVFVFLAGGCSTGDPAVDTTIKTDARDAKVDTKNVDAVKPDVGVKPDAAKADVKPAADAKTGG